MRLLQHVSIKRKLTFVAMITSGAALIVACALFSVYDFATARRMLLDETTTMADIVGGNSTAALSFGDRDAASVILRRLQTSESIKAAVIFDSAGQLFADFTTGERGAVTRLSPSYRGAQRASPSSQ